MIDYEYFRSTFPNQPYLIKDLIETILIEYPEFIIKFKYSLKNKNLRQLKILANKWQSTASIFGAQILRCNLEKIESLSQIEENEVYHLGQATLIQLDCVYEKLNRISTAKTSNYAYA